MIDALRPQTEGSTAAHPCARCLGGVALLLVCLLPGSAEGQDTGDAALLGGTMKDLAFCPSNPELMAYSRQVEDTQELYLYDASAGTVRQITAVEETGEEDTGGFFETSSDRSLRRFEGQLAWRPLRDPTGRQWFVFVSSASETGYGLFLSYLTPEDELADRIVELPFEGQAAAPTWSPDGNRLVFSGSSEGMEGNELFLYPKLIPFLRADEDSPESPSPVRLTESAGSLYPDWAPSGADEEYIAYQSKRTGKDGRANWGISLLDLSTREGPQSGARPRSVRLSGQLSAYHEYKPSWSPDGRYVAFYVSQSPVGASTGNRRQDIGVLQLVQGSRGQSVQAGRILERRTERRLAKNVLPNENRGPEWHTSDSLGASLIYVRKEENKDNPIYLAGVSRWHNDSANASRSLSAQFEEETRLHEEVTATRGAEGLRLAFASQEGERLRLQLRDGLGATDGVVQADPSDSTKSCMVQFSARKKNDNLLQNYKEEINKNRNIPGAEIIRISGKKMTYRLVTKKRFEKRGEAGKEKERIENVNSFRKKVIEKCFYEKNIKV